jgi:hypothetical protein
MRFFLTSALALTLCACGGSGSSEGEAVTGETVTEGAGGEAVETAALAGTAGERGIDCAAVRARPAQGPDVLGLAVGMPGDQAFDKLACAAPEMVVETMTAVDGSRSFRAQNGVEDISVYLSGPLGDDRVIEINRSSKPRSGDEPSIASLIDQLTAKYGTFVQTQNGGMIAYVHVKSVDGRVISDGDPLITGCVYNNDPKCGAMVTANFYPSPQNPGLAGSFQVIATDKAYAKKQLAAFQASAQQATQQRQADEIQQASGKATAL